jgi:cobalt-zinc-cadmium efflux system membrane fusion protein
MVNVRVRAANPEHLLRPNAFVQVTFLPAGEPRIVVPAEAVITDDQRAFVFVASPGPPLALTRRPVTTGRQNEQSIEILAGLQPGEKYVARGALLLLNAVDLAH